MPQTITHSVFICYNISHITLTHKYWIGNNLCAFQVFCIVLLYNIYDDIKYLRCTLKVNQQQTDISASAVSDSPRLILYRQGAKHRSERSWIASGCRKVPNPTPQVSQRAKPAGHQSRHSERDRETVLYKCTVLLGWKTQRCVGYQRTRLQDLVLEWSSASATRTRQRGYRTVGQLRVRHARPEHIHITVDIEPIIFY